MDNSSNQPLIQDQTNFWHKNKARFGALFLVLILGLILGRASAGYGFSEISNLPVRVFGLGTEAPTRYRDVNFELFWQIWDKLKSESLNQPVEDSKLFYGALKGAVASLGDPYTVFFSPTEAAEFKSELTGTFDGIGAELGFRNKAITIIAPLPQSPAERAGIRAGDIILEVDKKDVTSLSLDEVVRKIRGPKNTSVTLTIFRQGETKTREITVQRATIVVPPVTLSWKDIKGDKDKKNYRVGVIKLSTFQENTPNELVRIAREVVTKNTAAVIIDLRNNPGGYLDAAVAVASHWISQGIIVKEAYRDRVDEEWAVPGREPRLTLPTYILINKGSASASEILAGALQDNGLAVLIGETSFGKGSVQDFEDLGDGSAIKITIAKWLTPKGRQINEQGIEPNIKVELTPEDIDKNKDPQLDRALLEISKKF